MSLGKFMTELQFYNYIYSGPSNKRKRNGDMNYDFIN